MFFDEVVVFTDIHFGMKNNSRAHNQDCEDFIKWMIEEAHSRGITKCIFMGDWHHHRDRGRLLYWNCGLEDVDCQAGLIPTSHLIPLQFRRLGRQHGVPISCSGR